MVELLIKSLSPFSTQEPEKPETENAIETIISYGEERMVGVMAGGRRESDLQTCDFSNYCK